MKTAKLAPALLVLPLAIASLACPTRPIDSSGTGGAAGVATPGAGGVAGSGVPGAGGAAGTGNGTVGGYAGGASGSGGGVASSGAGGPGGAVGGAAGEGSGSAAGASGAAGGTAGAGGGAAGAAGSQAGAGGGAAGSAGARDGQPCSLAADCASRVCTGFYADVDGDGYGAGQPVGFCGTTAPIGYASMNGDCCDAATNIAVAKLIHPGADFQTTSAGGICGITWDYDCSGTVESNPQDCVGCSSYPSCQCVVGNLPENSCGTSGINPHNCVVASQTQSCMHIAVSGGPGTITCK